MAGTDIYLLFHLFLDTAYAKNCTDDNWYLFNDSHVSKVTDVKEVVVSRIYGGWLLG